jgi:hypothetical protein
VTLNRDDDSKRRRRVPFKTNRTESCLTSARIMWYQTSAFFLKVCTPCPLVPLGPNPIGTEFGSSLYHDSTAAIDCTQGPTYSLCTLVGLVSSRRSLAPCQDFAILHRFLCKVCFGLNLVGPLCGFKKTAAESLKLRLRGRSDGHFQMMAAVLLQRCS